MTQSRYFLTVVASLVASSALATPVDDFKLGINLSFRELASPYTVSGALSQTGTTNDGDFELLTKPSGSLTATADLFDLAHELNIHAVATMTGSQTAANGVKFVLSCPGAVGQTVNVTLGTTAVSVKITAVTGELNALVNYMVPSVDPISPVGRNVDLTPDISKSNFLQVNGLLGGLFPITFRTSPSKYEGRGGSASYMTGTVTLEGWTAASTGQQVTIQIYNTSNALLETVLTTLDQNGKYAFATGLVGVHHVSVKSSHWISSIRRNLVIGSDTSASFSLKNGDIDSDDVVSVFDYIILSNTFDAAPGDSNWEARADLDGDNVVSVFDYLQLSDNFDLQGPIEN